MNGFGFRATRNGLTYIGEYRLAHWAGHRQIREPNGKPVEYAHKADATLAAASQLISELNSDARFWRGPDGNEARQAAERLFNTRATDGEGGEEEG
jgi:hypothetical protein